MTNNLTSKFQYKNYEKGEFSEEQPRSLEETLELIKSFPWDTQRGVDVQLTCPGVVIEGNSRDYLKIGIYFNDKFAVYYLDSENHLFEFHTDNLETACQSVTEFFNEEINLDGFEKHLFSIGNRAHFIDGEFWHIINHTSAIIRLVFSTVLGLAYVIFVTGFIFYDTGAPWLAKVFFVLMIGLVIYLILMHARIYSRAKNMALWIAAGHDDFQFDDGSGTVKYSKKDIGTINIYGPTSTRSRPRLTIIELIFKDGQSIRFPGMLIDPYLFLGKISDNIPLNYLEQNNLFRKSVWQF